MLGLQEAQLLAQLGQLGFGAEALGFRFLQTGFRLAQGFHRFIVIGQEFAGFGDTVAEYAVVPA